MQRFAAILALACSASAFGCASHSDYTKDARSALDAGKPKEALKLYNEALDVKSEKDLPKNLGGKNTLFLLDRSMILQALRAHPLSSRDLEIADKQIEVLDFSRSTVDDIGKYMFSDDTGPYKAPIYEKLMINTMNMVNYLARRDLNGARIEARRLSVMQNFVKSSEGAKASLNAPGSYLAGFVFEKSNDADAALRYYDEALQSEAITSLDEAIWRLSKISSYRSPRIEAVLKRHAPEIAVSVAPPAVATESAPDADVEVAPSATQPENENPAEVLVIVNYGRVPAKVPKRIPIGLALTYASGAISPANHATANRLAAQGLVTWVNYPELGRPHGNFDSPLFSIDGRREGLEELLAVDREAHKAWEDARGSIVASAITRLITRIVAGETAGKASGGGTVGAIVSILTQATLTVTDTPDTRSWSTLPARIAVTRIQVAPGSHAVELSARGQREQHNVVVKPGDWAVLNLTVLR